MLRFDGFCPAAFVDLRLLLADAGDERRHARCIIAGPGRVEVKLRGDGGVQLLVRSAHRKLASITPSCQKCWRRYFGPVLVQMPTFSTEGDLFVRRIKILLT